MTNASMKARVIDSFPAPTLDEIKRFEARNGVVLPGNTSSFSSLRTAGSLPANTRLSGRRATTASTRSTSFTP